mmetsp:Transcript_39583/g.112254  ORF Transcript_39583/g.112254 Transcript_39583/m.112254 type:complete len:137 (-) Transcript_39583:55-465(-)
MQRELEKLEGELDLMAHAKGQEGFHMTTSAVLAVEPRQVGDKARSQHARIFTCEEAVLLSSSWEGRPDRQRHLRRREASLRCRPPGRRLRCRCRRCSSHERPDWAVQPSQPPLDFPADSTETPLPTELGWVLPGRL